MTNFSQIHTDPELTADSENIFPLGEAQLRTDEDSHNLAMAIAQAADDRKGSDIMVLKVSDVSYVADYFVIATGFSSVQVRAIARSIQEKVELEWQQLPLRVEGFAEGAWVLLDFGDVIAHIFMPKEREFYSLEAFWGHADRVEFTSSSTGIR